MLVRNAKELGHLVREHRIGRGLAQGQLAAAVGVSRQWILAVEAGKETVALVLVLRTLRALGMEFDARKRTVPARKTGKTIRASKTKTLRPPKRRPRRR